MGYPHPLLLLPHRFLSIYSNIMRFTSLIALSAIASAGVQAIPQPLEIIAISLPFGLGGNNEHQGQRVNLGDGNSFFSTLSMPTWGSSSKHSTDRKWSANDVCPDLKVSCVKDGKTVGDIGKKEFCWNRDDGLLFDRLGSGSYYSDVGEQQSPFGSKKVGCSQCHPTKDDAECNLKFAKECAAQCQAQGPLGGH